MKSKQYVRCHRLALPLLLFAVCAQATEIRDPSVSSNPAINNSSVRLDGRLHQDIRGVPPDFCFDLGQLDGCFLVPWVINVFAGSAVGGVRECLRLDVVAPAQFLEGVDLYLVVIDQFGQVYKNDHRSSSDLRPLVKIDNIPEPGWFTVIVQRSFDETPAIDFTLRYGRYNQGNPNCANPTQPLF